MTPQTETSASETMQRLKRTSHNSRIVLVKKDVKNRCLVQVQIEKTMLMITLLEPVLHEMCFTTAFVNCMCEGIPIVSALQRR